MDENLPQEVSGDKERFKQVAVNLISNAIVATSQGEVKISFSYNYIAGHLKFSVTDTGVGIRNSDKKRIFDSLNKISGSESPKEGEVGLGLYISQ